MRKATVRENLYGEIIFRLHQIAAMLTNFEMNERAELSQEKPKRSYKKRESVAPKKRGRPPKKKV